MSSLWDRTYFAEDYRAFIEAHACAEQTASQVEYLRAILGVYAPARRVVVLGYSIRPVAVGLAQAGFRVTALEGTPGGDGDQPPRRDGDVQWARVDLLAGDSWPLSEVDAAVCIDAPGWETEAHQRRLLRRVRRHLAPNSILVWVHCHASGVRDNDSMAVGEATYRFHEQIDALQGRSQARLVVSQPGQVERVHFYDRRLYSVAELAALVRSAGYDIDRVDTNFARQPACASAPPSLQVIARPLPPPPNSLAVASWRTPPTEGLELRYAPEESQWLDPTPTAIWESFLSSEAHHGADAVEYYPVDDPYGSERAAEVVAVYFDCPVAPSQVTFGPGVTSLLHDLCDLSDGGLIVAPQLTHPDVTAWAVARGYPVYMIEEPVTLDSLLETLYLRRPTLIHLDRPNFAGELMSLDDVTRLGQAAARFGAVVLIDEAPCTYLGPTQSAAPLIQRLPNLVIVRGLTKAYSWGGLRAGYALASEAISDRVRQLVPPLQVGELALRAVLHLLAAGDIFGRLRARIRAMKPTMVALLKAHGLEVIEGHPDLPWVVVPDALEETSRRLARLGIRGLPFVPSPAALPPYPELLHLSIALSDERMDTLRQRLADEPDAGRH